MLSTLQTDGGQHGAGDPAGSHSLTYVLLYQGEARGTPHISQGGGGWGEEVQHEERHIPVLVTKGEKDGPLPVLKVRAVGAVVLTVGAEVD